MENQRDIIITQLYASQCVEKAAKRYLSYFKDDDDFNDFIQHIYLIICLLPEHKLIELNEKLELVPYIIKVVGNQITNSKSSYHKQMEHHIDKVSDEVFNYLDGEDDETE